MGAEVVDNGGFKLVRVTEDVAEGELVWLLDGPIVTTPTRTSIHVGAGIHVEDEVGGCVNHSCDPTCEVRDGALYALADMSKGTEVTFDYTASEAGPLASPFTCHACGGLLDGSEPPCR